MEMFNQCVNTIIFALIIIFIYSKLFICSGKYIIYMIVYSSITDVTKIYKKYVSAVNFVVISVHLWFPEWLP